MFTGIIEETGTIESLTKQGINLRLTVGAQKVLAETQIGDSIAVNGLCLTVTEINASSFAADIMPETLRKTSLARAKKQNFVNLERALKLTDRLGGHWVSGHIDGTGILRSIQREQNALILQVQSEPDLLKYIIPKGSIALDGVSLTVVDAQYDKFSVSIIPHSAQSTCLGHYRPGDPVNIECDIIGKYVEKLITGRMQGQKKDRDFVAPRSPALTLDFLKTHGY